MIASILLNTRDERVKQLLLEAGSTDFGEDADINALKKKFSGAKNDGSKEAKYRRFLSILKIIITFLQIMSNLDTTFSHVPWPLEFSWFLKIFDFVNFDIFESLYTLILVPLQPKDFTASFILHMLVLPTFLLSLYLAYSLRMYVFKRLKIIFRGKVKSAGGDATEKVKDAENTLKATESKLNNYVSDIDKKIEALNAEIKALVSDGGKVKSMQAQDKWHRMQENIKGGSKQSLARNSSKISDKKRNSIAKPNEGKGSAKNSVNELKKHLSSLKKQKAKI